MWPVFIFQDLKWIWIFYTSSSGNLISDFPHKNMECYCYSSPATNPSFCSFKFATYKVNFHFFIHQSLFMYSIVIVYLWQSRGGFSFVLWVQFSSSTYFIVARHYIFWCLLQDVEVELCRMELKSVEQFWAKSGSICF